MRDIVIAITGASGSIYAMRLVERIQTVQDITVHLVISEWAEKVMHSERHITTQQWIETLEQKNLVVHDVKDLSAPISSGSFRFESMVVIPCSMDTLGAIAAGLAGNLIQRAGSVALKERRNLILVARESPLSAIHLQQMLTLTHAGAMILPPIPYFYHHPESVQELVDSTVERVLDALKVTDPQIKRWRDT
ncbi:MAG: UbiX family flavin prenyltransferase [Sphaerochaetaceae bacterium]|nr:UbiX family flavin prenyltransferase [Sphaerochaetaceae bacterium]